MTFVISNRQLSLVLGFIPLDDRMMLRGLKNTLGLTSLFAVYAHSEMSLLDEKKMFNENRDSGQPLSTM